MSIALYRKYRSKSLDEVVGQRHVTELLSNAIKQNRISHAYLFTGPRGVGKTSIARILAHEINQIPYNDETTSLDIIEIDAASNNGVEDVRDLRDKVQIAPVSSQKKIYIIDEVHMLSKPAFNALLKTLEEPPEHVVFILATTDVDKLPATIVSRTQRFSFRSINKQDAISHLRHIAESENIRVDDEALQLIAERGDGSFRDSISLLDQLASLADKKTGITTGLIETSLGLAPKKIVDTIIEAVEDHDIESVVSLLSTSINQGINPVTLSDQLTAEIRSAVVKKPHLLGLLDALLDVPKSLQPELKLLSVLGTAAAQKPTIKNAALAVPVREVTATIAELEKKATQVKPTDTVVVSPSQKNTLTDSGPLEETIRKTTDSSEFDWNSYLDYMKHHHVAIYSVLSKCHAFKENDDVTLYTGNKFYKKKLDDQKYSSVLYKSLEELGIYGLTIHTIPTAPPPKDSQAASVAAIMGGGEEVSI